jgi:nitrite reductase/ring-hydroxylating ferredoxin subunit
MPTYLCRVDEIADGAARGFDTKAAGRDTIFIVRRGNAVNAWRDACPHVDGAPLAWRKDAYLNADGQAIVCYGHGAVFDLDTGVCSQGPCIGQSLTPVAVERDPEGALWIAADPV